MADYLRLVGPFHAHSGYSHMTRAALRMALLAGYTVQAVESDTRIQYTMYRGGRVDREDVMPKISSPIPDCQMDEVERSLTTDVPEDAPTVLIQLPSALYKRCMWVAGPRIGWTMAESDRLCREWAEGARAVDTVLVPSRWCAAAFTRSVAGADVRVLPIPVDTRVFIRHGPKAEIKGDPPPFLFCSVFTTTERKQWRLLMQAFTEEFGRESEAVGLIVKPHRVAEVQEMASWCRSAGAWVGVDTQERSDWDMATLYRACNVNVLPSSEGFGLPFVEAALCGLPSVALDAGGAADVVDDRNGYRVPTTMQPLIGHMPQAYPSDHRWPTASLDDLRDVLREAYEQEKAGAGKGEQAQADAEARFTPEVIAPRLVAEIERASQRRARRTWVLPSKVPEDLKPEQRPLVLPQWALAFGAWGDVFCSIGMAQQMRDPRRPLHVIHYGLDPHIQEFLRAQPFISHAQYVKPESLEAFQRFWAKSANARFGYVPQWLPEFCEPLGIDPADVLLSQINQSEDQPVCRWHDAVLPEAARHWAREQAADWPEYILVQPLSTASARAWEHWPLWQEALTWLVEETPYTYVVVGQNRMPLPRKPNCINLIGQTPSMMHALALAEQARGVLSTCNAMSLWTAMQRIPALICSNVVFTHKGDYYHRWVKTEPNTVLYHYDTLEWFRQVAWDWLAARFGVREAPNP